MQNSIAPETHGGDISLGSQAMCELDENPQQWSTLIAIRIMKTSDPEAFQLSKIGMTRKGYRRQRLQEFNIAKSAV